MSNFALLLIIFLISQMYLEDTGLVLEGGGMRGIFTIGVLDAFIEYGVQFPYAVGVSAGACNGPSYLSGQRGRAYFSNVKMMEKYGHRYLGIRQFLKTGNLFNVPLLYDELPNRIFPFEYDKYYNSDTEFEIVVTNLETGGAEYISNRDPRIKGKHKQTMDIILASSSLPYVSKIVRCFGEPMLDGGLADSIPVERTRNKGYERQVVILTRNRGYRKKTKRSFTSRVMVGFLNWLLYRRYPNFINALNNRSQFYNKQLELVERLEKEGKIMVLRPEKQLTVDRIERNAQRLQALYDEGLDIGRRFCRKLAEQKHNQAAGHA